MVIFNIDTDEENCCFIPTEKTKTFIVGFFGFFPFSISDEFNDLLKSLGTTDMIKSFTQDINFELDGVNGFLVHCQSGRKTFDFSVVLPKTFISELDAIEWFNKTSTLPLSFFDSIKVFDGDVFIDYIKKSKKYNDKTTYIKNEITKNLKLLKEKMINDFKSDPEYEKIIKKIIEGIDI